MGKENRRIYVQTVNCLQTGDNPNGCERILSPACVRRRTPTWKSWVLVLLDSDPESIPNQSFANKRASFQSKLHIHIHLAGTQAPLRLLYFIFLTCGLEVVRRLALQRFDAQQKHPLYSWLLPRHQPLPTPAICVMLLIAVICSSAHIRRNEVDYRVDPNL